MSLKSFIHKRFINPILGQLKQGISPHKLALSLATGSVMGIFPILGPVTSICVLLGLIFKLNHVAVQAANYAVYPVQIALLIPFYRMGEKIFMVGPVPLVVDDIIKEFQSGFMAAVEKYAMTGLYGVVAWLIVSPIIFAIIYKISFTILNKVSRK